MVEPRLQKLMSYRTTRKQTLTTERQTPLLAYSVEKLCFDKSGDFICDLSGITYCRYEGVAEVV